MSNDPSWAAMGYPGWQEPLTLPAALAWTEVPAP